MQVWVPEVHERVVVVELPYHVRVCRPAVEHVRHREHRRVRLAHPHQEVLPADVARLHPAGHGGAHEGEQVELGPPVGPCSSRPPM